MSETQIGIRLSLDGAQQVSTGVQRVRGELEGIGRAGEQAQGGAERLSSALARIGHYGAAGGALYATAQTARAVGAALFEASTNADRLRTSLNFATGNSAKEMAYLDEMSNRLGLAFDATASAYASFAAATKGTALQGQGTRTVFEATAQAAAVMGLSADQASGALLAMQQMMAKGVVSAEEFRGQLGERLPIAMQAATKALGVTSAEFSKMLESGQIIAADFLPKFATAMQQLLGDSAAAAAQRLDASVNQMDNAWQRLKRTVGDSGVSSFMAGEARSLARYMDSVSEAMEAAGKRGAGALGQLNAAAGLVIVRAPFDALSGSANLLNAAINTLSGGFLKLDTSVNLLPYSLRSASEQAAILPQRLAQAKSELATLQAQLERAPENIYLKSSAHDAWKLVQQLEAASRAKRTLAQADATAAGIQANGAAREAWEKQRAALKEKAGQWSDKYAPDTEKLALELGKARAELGDLFTPELEQRIRNHFVKPQTDGASALQRMREAARNYLADLQAQAQAAETVAAQGNALTKEQEALAKAEEMVREGRVRSKDIDRDAIIAAARRIDLAAEQKRTQEDLNKATLDAARAHDAYVVSLSGAAQKLADDVAAQRDATARLGLSKEAVAELDAAKLELLATDKELLAIKALDRNEDTLAYEALKAQAQGYRDLAQAKREYAAKDATQELAREAAKAAEKAQADWQKAADKIQDSITDALMRGFESGKGFAENLRDTVVNMFKTLVLRPVVEFGVRGGLTALGLGGLSGAANAASSALGAAGGLGDLSSLLGLGSALPTSAFGLGLQGSIATIAEQGFISGFGNAMTSAQALASAGSFTGALGAALPYVGAAVAGAAALQALGGMFDGGREYTTGTGLKVGLGSGGTLVRNYQNWKNDGSPGLFGIGASGSSSGTNYSAADAATSAAIAAQAADLRKTYAEYAKVIGGDAQAIMDYYKEFSVALGSDAEANKKAVAAMFGEFADGLATAATATKEYGLSWYAREGETAGATLQRLATSLSAVNGWLDVFNDSLGNTEAVLTRAQQASVLVDKFGGLDAFNAASSAYYQAMYSEQERMEKAAQAMAKVFLELNVAAPQTIEQYNALRNSLDLMTDQGREAYATLTKMGPQFAQVANYAQAAATKMAAAVQAQVEKELGIAATWSRKLAVLQGTTTERQLQLQSDLASTANDATKQLILQVYAQEDLKAATEAATAAQQAHAAEVERLGSALEQAKSAAATAQSAVESVRSEATSAYLQSLSEVTAAQAALTKAQQDAQLKLINAQIDAQIDVARAANAAAAEMKTFGQRLHEFVDGATLEPTAEFGKLLAQALAGDKAAMQALPEAANAAIAQAQERASSATAFALDKAAIVGKVAQVAALADRLGAATVAMPERVSAPEQDPVAAATAELAAAQTRLTQSLAVANAISAPLTASVTDLIAKFTVAQTENAKALADVAAAQTALDAIKGNTAATATGVGTVASTGTQQLTQLQAITASTAATVTNLASYATGAQRTVAFAANDPIYSVFANISRTNELLIDAQQLTLHTLLGVAINEDLTAAGAFNSVFQGTYSVQFDSLQVLHNILWQAQVANSKLEAVAVAAAQSKDLQSATVATLVAQYNHAQYISAAGQYVRFARTAPGTDVFATGGVFTNSIVTRPTSFRLGQMGEAGPEAIMPLANINGSLGVRAAGFDLGPLLEELNALRAEVAALRKENSAENRAALYHLANTADATGSIKRNGVQVFTDASEPLLTQVAA